MKKKILLGIVLGLTAYFGMMSNVSKADNAIADFESFTLGNINGQDGWSKTGPYDVEIVNNTYPYPSFGTKTLRISNALTSGSFGDWVFTKSLNDEAGESTSVNAGQSGGTRQNQFKASFDFGTAVATFQPGLQISVSPDRGDGARMSFIRLEDSIGGIDVIFSDVQGTTDPANFVITTIASDLNRSIPHNLRIEMDFVEGASNDIVRIYVDNVLVHTGTSWENYYRFDDESQAGDPGLVNKSRTVDSLIIQARSSSTAPGTLGNGFVLDNFNLSTNNFSVPTVTPTPNPFAVPAQCTGTYGAPIIGTSGSDKINGTSGNDLIFGLNGSDRIDGKGGDDCIVGGNGSDIIDGGSGLDVILGGANSDTLKGGGDNDKLYGEAGSDSMDGGSGDDMLDGGPGTDSAKGGSDNDTCTAESVKQCEV